RIMHPKPNSTIYTDWWEDIPVYNRDPETGKIISYDFFGGNLYGVLKKLPYLQELGVSVIYLNPIFESPSNHKYDTSDYKKIDPMFGDNELFQTLCREAKELGIAIILDGVFSHTGSDSIYFNKEGNYPEVGAYQSPESPYYSWYRFSCYPDLYECWWGIDTLPNVNEMEPSYQNFIIYDEDSVLKYWMKLGAKGWRLDVVDELPDEFVKNFYRVLKETDPEAVLIGEVWEDASNKISYGKLREYLLGDELDSVMNYPFRNIFLDYLLGRRDARETHLALMQLYENYPRQHFYALMNLIGSHDVPRVLTLLGDAPPEQTISKEDQAKFRLSPDKRKLAVRRLKLLSLIQMTFPGVPCVYYGDEAGLEGYGDPLNRRTYPWGREDRELLVWYKKIIALRNRHDVLKTGEWIPLYAQGHVYAFLRRISQDRDVFGQKKKDNVAILIFNRHETEEITLTLDVSRWCRGKLVDVLGEREIFLEDGRLSVVMKPLEGKVLLQDVNFHS
ncbi:MAG: glycoside hydrolase family 13 protein, partial [Bacillota bacterium]